MDEIKKDESVQVDETKGVASDASNTLTLVLGAMVLVMATAGIMYFLMKEPSRPPLPPTLPPIEEVDIKPEVVEDKAIVDVIKKGEIKWQKPVKTDLVDLQSFYVFYKVGDVITGDLQGSEVFLMPNGDGMGGPVIYHLIKTGRKYTILLADNPDSHYTIDMFTKEITVSPGAELFFSDIPKLEELQSPDKVTDNIGADYYKVMGSGFSGSYEIPEFNYNEGVLKKRADFSDPKLGQAWISESESGVVLFEFPDTGIFSYSYVSKLFSKENPESDYTMGKKLNISEGPKKLKESTFTSGPVGGCGQTEALTIKTGINLERDTVRVATDAWGNGLYIYKEPAGRVDIAKLYEEYLDRMKRERDTTVPQPIYHDISIEEFNAQEYPLVFWKGPGGRIESYYNSQNIPAAECGKPVIYLYPEEETEVNVQVRPDAGFTVTDPEYGDIRGNGWTVLAKPNGDLTNLVDGKKYPYLFWEGNSNVFYSQPKSGWVVAGASLEEDFPEILHKVGLNEKESVDFMEFWIPKMRESQKPYYFVTFVGNKFMDKTAPLSITPRPDMVWRILMDYEGLDEWQEVDELEVVVPERRGFTVVEWGGRLK